MSTPPTSSQTIDDYIAGFPPEVQARLEQVRLTIRQAAPDAKETIKYQIPTFTLNGNLLSFAAYPKHIGVYPAPAGNAKFRKALAVYRAGKSSVRFPLDKPIPDDLLGQLVKFRVKEQLGRVAAKRKPK